MSCVNLHINLTAHFPVKGGPYSITESGIPELISVLGRFSEVLRLQVA